MIAFVWIFRFYTAWHHYPRSNFWDTFYHGTRAESVFTKIQKYGYINPQPRTEEHFRRTSFALLILYRLVVEHIWDQIHLQNPSQLYPCSILNSILIPLKILLRLFYFPLPVSIAYFSNCFKFYGCSLGSKIVDWNQFWRLTMTLRIYIRLYVLLVIGAQNQS